MADKKIIAFSILGTQLDFAGWRAKRWEKWRPTVSLCWQDEFKVSKLHLLHDNRSDRLANTVIADIEEVSPATQIIPHPMNFIDPWDFEEVFAKLFDLCASMTFDTSSYDYLFHITTGTHVAQICIFLLAESRHFPGRLIQTAPKKVENKSKGQHQIIDLDLSRYDQIASRFQQQQLNDEAFLKGGIETRNKKFNALITQLEKVVVRSKAPILLQGPTGAGKSQLAERIYQLKKRRESVSGAFVAVNCATLKGDSAMSALFGHIKGAFTGALNKRAGFLLKADKGLLFLDEIGELGLDEQAMLLHALENKSFYPVGSDSAIISDFQLIAGTNQDLQAMVADGKFREDLLSRINLWTYKLPGLCKRPEDIEPNIDFELDNFFKQEGKKVEFRQQAKTDYLSFAISPAASWAGNFRDLNASIFRMGTLADAARIGESDVQEEIKRLEAQWQPREEKKMTIDLRNYLTSSAMENLDCFERNQLEFVISICCKHPSMAAAGRELFDKSRLKKAKSNDSARLQKYLAKYDLSFDTVKQSLHKD